MLRELLGWGLLAVALGLAGLAINAVRPIRRSRVLLLPSFLAGTLLVLARNHEWQKAAFTAHHLVG